MISASSAALQCWSEALFSTAAEVLLQAQPLPSRGCRSITGSTPAQQGYANAGADSTSMQEDAHVEAFFLLFINVYMDKSPDHHYGLWEFK